MEFNEVINKRRTSREWTDREVDFDAVKRIIEAGMKALSWDHYRNWQFIVLHTKDEKENAFRYAKSIAEKFGVPSGWMTPCFIGIGYPKEDELILEQYDSNPDGHIHMGGWRR